MLAFQLFTSRADSKGLGRVVDGADPAKGGGRAEKKPTAMAFVSYLTVQEMADKMRGYIRQDRHCFMQADHPFRTTG